MCYAPEKELGSWLFRNTANIVTFVGMLTGISATVILWLSPENIWPIVILFAITALSDKIDGTIARELGIVSAAGKALDRMRDKLFHCSMLLVLAWRYLEQQGLESPSALIAAILVIMVIALEILLTCSLVYGIVKNKEVGAGNAGKIKVILEYCLIGIWLVSLLAESQWNAPVLTLSIWLVNLLLFLTTCFAFGSLARYYRLHFGNGNSTNSR